MHPDNNQASAVELSSFNPKGDLPMVEKWLRYPHVARWWGNPKEAIAAIRNHDTLASAIILVDSTPIGYLCWQTPTHKELADTGLADLPADLVDIDIMIGEPSALGHGYGPEALSQLLAKLHDDGVKIVGMATAESNQRARKAFKKAGFRLFRTFTESGEQMRYLTREPDTAA
ncbi:MAG: acetyltransferase [Candidatus Thiodiazotropha sp. (ex. Lucinisca nassula)]|nr:acetyltransferase [Candidatus Thiodiazotropha sp. (ex. Lucinisca nassula)]